MQIAKSIGIAEHVPVAERAEHLLGKGTDALKKVSEPIEDISKLWEVGKKSVDFPKRHPIAASLISGAVGTETHRIGEFAKDAEHRIAHGVGAAGHTLSNNVSHVAHEVGERARATAKTIADDIKVWSPDMPFEQFGAFINKVRGVSPTVASVSSDKAHEHHVGPSKVPPTASDLGYAY